MICYHLKSDLDFMAPDLDGYWNLFDGTVYVELLLMFMKSDQLICVVDDTQYCSTAISLFKGMAPTRRTSQKSVPCLAAQKFYDGSG